MSKGNRRFRAGEIGLSYERQGLIWFTARTYAEQPEHIRRMIREACEEVGGENAPALFAYVTTSRSIVSIMREFYIASETTIYRMINSWYRAMDRRMRGK